MVPARIVAEMREKREDATFSYGTDALVVDFVEMFADGENAVDMHVREWLVPEPRVEVIAAVHE